MKAKVLLVSLIHYFLIFSAHTNIDVLKRKLGRLTGTLSELRGKLQTLGGERASDVPGVVIQKFKAAPFREGEGDLPLPLDVPTGEAEVGGVFAAVEEQAAGETETWGAYAKRTWRENWGKILIGLAVVVVGSIIGIKVYKHYYPDSDADEDKLEMTLSMAEWGDDDISAKTRDLKSTHPDITEIDIRNLRDDARRAVKKKALEILEREEDKPLRQALMDEDWGLIVALIDAKIDKEEERSAVETGPMRPLTQKQSLFIDTFLDHFEFDFPTVIFVNKTLSSYDYPETIWNVKVGWLNERGEDLSQKVGELTKAYQRTEAKKIELEDAVIAEFEKKKSEGEAYQTWRELDQLRESAFKQTETGIKFPLRMLRRIAGNRTFSLYEDKVTQFLSVMDSNVSYDANLMKFCARRLAHTSTREEALKRMEYEYKKRTFMREKSEAFTQSIKDYCQDSFDQVYVMGKELWQKMKKGLSARIDQERRGVFLTLLGFLDPFMESLWSFKIQRRFKEQLEVDDSIRLDVVRNGYQSELSFSEERDFWKSVRSKMLRILNSQNELWKIEAQFLLKFLSEMKSSFSLDLLNQCPTCPIPKFRELPKRPVEEKIEAIKDHWGHFTSAWQATWGPHETNDIFYRQRTRKFNDWKLYTFLHRDEQVKDDQIVYSFQRKDVEVEHERVLEEYLKKGRELLEGERASLEALRTKTGREQERVQKRREIREQLRQWREKDDLVVGFLTQEDINKIVEEDFFTVLPKHREKFREYLKNDQLYKIYEEAIEIYLQTWRLEEFEGGHSGEGLDAYIQQVAHDFAQSSKTKIDRLFQMNKRVEAYVNKVVEVLGEKIKEKNREREHTLRELGRARWKNILEDAIDMVDRAQKSPFEQLSFYQMVRKLMLSGIIYLTLKGHSRLSFGGGKTLLDFELLKQVFPGWQGIILAGLYGFVTKGNPFPVKYGSLKERIGGLEGDKNLQKNKRHLEAILLGRVPELQAFGVENITADGIDKSEEFMADYLGVTLQDRHNYRFVGVIGAATQLVEGLQRGFQDIGTMLQDIKKMQEESTYREKELAHLKSFGEFTKETEDESIDTFYTNLYAGSAVPLLLDQINASYCRVINIRRSTDASFKFDEFLKEKKSILRKDSWRRLFLERTKLFKTSSVWNINPEDVYVYVEKLGEVYEKKLREGSTKGTSDPYPYAHEKGIREAELEERWRLLGDEKLEDLRAVIRRKYEEQKRAILERTSEGQQLVGQIKKGLFFQHGKRMPGFDKPHESYFIYRIVEEACEQAVLKLIDFEHARLDQLFSPEKIVQQIRSAYEPKIKWIETQRNIHFGKIFPPSQTPDLRQRMEHEVWYRFLRSLTTPSLDYRVCDDIKCSMNKLIKAVTRGSRGFDPILKKKIQEKAIDLSKLIADRIKALETKKLKKEESWEIKQLERRRKGKSRVLLDESRFTVEAINKLKTRLSREGTLLK